MALLLDEKDRFSKAKALHTFFRTTSPPKLQIVCFDFFISIAENIVSEWKKSGENAFDQLPNILRNELLNYLLSEAYEKIWNKEQFEKHLYKLTYMLMNRTTAKLDYSGDIPLWLTTFQEFGEILANAAVKCPNLENLAVHGCENVDVSPLFEWAKNAMSPGSGIDHLLQLEHLRHLDLYGIWYWTDEGLNKLFSQLKKLITLKLLIHSSATVGGFQKSHLLKELEAFYFVIDDPDEEYDSDGPIADGFSLNCESIYSFCAENVPCLKVIGVPTSSDKDFNSTSIFLSDLRHITPKIKGISNLEHLHSNKTLPEAEFPNLQHLYFIGPISADVHVQFFNKFGTFTHLTSLILGRLTSDEIAKMLELVGTQLKTLSIFKGDTVDLFQILHLCPNLVRFDENEFNIIHRGDGPSKYEALVTEHNVRLLEHVEAYFDGSHGGKDRLFELLVFAPFMKELWLTFITMTKNQCQLFHDLEEGKLRKLSCVFLSCIKLDPTCSMDDFSLFVQCLVCSAPCLYFVSIDWSDPDLSDEWKSEQNVAQSFMNLVSSI